MSVAEDEGPPLKRVTVTHPMTTAVHRPRVPGSMVDLRRQSDIDDLAVQTIMRANLRLSLRYLFAVVGALAFAVLCLKYLPWLHTRSMLSFPLSWWLLGGVSFISIGVLAVRYVRAVERLERRFVALAGSSDRSRK